MEEIWLFLDDEYGKDSELTSERVAHLHDFQYSKSAVTEASKFKELHKCWTTVYSDLDSVGKLQILDHAPTIKGFITKLPGKAIGDRYIAMAKELKLKKESDLNIVNAFMKAERQHQKQQEELFGSKGSVKDSQAKGRCFNCNETGHRLAQCPSKTSRGTKRNHGTKQMPPK